MKAIHFLSLSILLLWPMDLLAINEYQIGDTLSVWAQSGLNLRESDDSKSKAVAFKAPIDSGLDWSHESISLLSQGYGLHTSSTNLEFSKIDNSLLCYKSACHIPFSLNIPFQGD